MKMRFLGLILLFATNFAVASQQCDFNGDGYEDLAVGVQEDFSNSQDYGYVHVLYGTSRGLSTKGTQVWHRNIPGIPGDPVFGQFFGAALACGDFDGDNYADLAIHANNDSGTPGVGVGNIYILYGSSSGLTATGVQLWAPTSPGITGIAQFYASLASGDFNGDGFSDLAAQVEPNNFIGGSGGVSVLYGSSSGLSSANYQLWTQNTPGVADTAENGDAFGKALVAENFGKDGTTHCYDDLAISTDEGFPVPDDGENGGHSNSVGSVHVIYGSSSGLTAAGSQYFHQDTSGVPDANEDFDQFGFALAAGAFRGTKSVCGGLISDLAIGIPGENNNGGAVQVLYAKTSGLSTDGNQRWTQNTTGVTDATEAEDYFGRALAAGRTSSGRYYLAIASPGESIGTLEYAGIVQVLFPDSTTGKLTANGMKTFNQNTSGIADSVEGGDQFGLSLTAGNFNNFGTEELVIGVPNETINGQLSGGVIHVLHGAGTVTTQYWNQDSNGVPDSVEPLDRFGWVLSQ
jgi:hypothetical protein